MSIMTVDSVVITTTPDDGNKSHTVRFSVAMSAVPSETKLKKMVVHHFLGRLMLTPKSRDMARKLARGEPGYSFSVLSLESKLYEEYNADLRPDIPFSIDSEHLYHLSEIEDEAAVVGLAENLKNNSAALEVLGQLIKNGATWDGDVCSKSGRDDLLTLGLATRIVHQKEQGYQAATYEGYRVFCLIHGVRCAADYFKEEKKG